MKLTPLAFSLVLFSGSFLDACPKHQDIKAYQAEANVLYKQLESKALSAPEAMNKAKVLMSTSKPILEQVIAHNSQCKAYLQAALMASDTMLELTEAELESGYHEGGALPKTAPACYYAKDLLVHAATVYVLAKESKPQWQAKAMREIKEVISHAQFLCQPTAEMSPD